MSASHTKFAAWVMISLFAPITLMAADEGGWIDLNAPSPDRVDKLIIQDNRSFDDEPPPVKPRPQPQKPKTPPTQKDGPCTANASISIKEQSSGTAIDILYFTPSPAGKSFRYNVSAPGLAESGFTAKIVPKPDYTSRRLGRVEIKGGLLTYTTPQPEDTFEGVLEIRSNSAPAICRSLPIRIEDGGCLKAGTGVTMSDGTTKSIETVKPGDLIIALDNENSRLSEAVVEKLIVHDEITFILHELIPENGVPLLVTGNHPIMVKGRGWQQVDNIRPGDVIFHRDSTSGSLIETTVASIIRDRSEQGTVYNLKTSRGNYIANDILVHNKCLAKGTLVNTPSGKRPIESLLPGDHVLGSIDGEIVPVRVTNVYAKDTILPTLPGKRLSIGVLATANHQIVKSGVITSVGEMRLPDESIAGTVYDIRTDSGNYVSGEYIMVTGD